jgi:hypothetical protein
MKPFPTTRRPAPDARPRRRRPARQLVPFCPPLEHRTAAALDDAVEADALIAELLALVEGGLVDAIDDGVGDVRYAVRDAGSIPAP